MLTNYMLRSTKHDMGIEEKIFFWPYSSFLLKNSLAIIKYVMNELRFYIKSDILIHLWNNKWVFYNNTNGLEIKTNNQEIVIIFWVTCENKSWKTWEVNLKSIIMCWFNYRFVLSLWSFFLYWMLPASNILLLMLFHDNLYAFFVLFMCWMRSFLFFQKNRFDAIKYQTISFAS